MGSGGGSGALDAGTLGEIFGVPLGEGVCVCFRAVIVILSYNLKGLCLFLNCTSNK